VTAGEAFSNTDLLWKDGKRVVDVSIDSHPCKSTAHLYELFSLKALGRT